MRPVYCVLLGFFTAMGMTVGFLYSFLGKPGPASFVEVQFVAPVGSDPLYHIEIMSGPDKSLMAGISAGEIEDVKIYPNDSSGNEIVLFIYRDERNPDKYKSWRGKRHYPPGTRFRTRIQINEQGEVISERSCKLPCSFD